MYLSYWNLKKKPFEIGNDPLFYYPASSHQTILLKLRYLFENRRGNGLLMGKPGTGKSLLVSMLAQFRRKGASLGPVLEVNMPQLSAEDFLFYFAEKLESFFAIGQRGGKEDDLLKSAAEERPPIYKAYSAIERNLKRFAAEKQKPILVLDGAERVQDSQLWSVLKSLISLEAQGTPLLSFLLLVSDENFPRPIPFIEDHLEAVAELHSLDEMETAAYIDYRLKKAGSDPTDIFTSKAKEVIWNATEGNPRRINRICDLALLVGFAEQLSQIDDNVIVNLNNELIYS